MALSENMKFDDDVISVYQQSWEKSRKTNNEFFEYIARLSPRNTNEIIQLNEARKRVVFLAPVLAQVTQNIQVCKIDDLILSTKNKKV